MSGRTLFRNKTTAVVAGVGLFVLGSLCLRDAWESRGQKPPWPVRAVSWW